MGAWAQLRLLLHKNFLLRTRQPVILALEILWPVAIILMVLALRLVIPPQQQNTCYYNARAMPSGGGLPFLQSFICNIDNDCNNETSYEEIPSYQNARVDDLLKQVSPLMSDTEIIALVKALPKGVNLMRAVIDTLSLPTIQEILEKGLPVKRLLKDSSIIGDILLKEAGIDSPLVSEALSTANLSIHKIFEIVGGPMNIATTVCSPGALDQYLVLQKKGSLQEVSNALCALDGKSLSKLVNKIQGHVDGGKIIKMVSDLMNQFGRPDVGRMLDDIGTMVDTVFSLPSIMFSNSKAANITKYLPKLKALVEPLKRGDINLGLLGDVSRDIEPFFDNTPNGSKVKTLLRYFGTLSNLVKRGLKTLPETNPSLRTFLRNPVEIENHLKNSFSPVFLDAFLNAKLKPEQEPFLKELNTPKKIFVVFCENPGVSNLFDFEALDSKLKSEIKGFQDSLCVLFLNGSSLEVASRNIVDYDEDDFSIESDGIFVQNTSQVIDIVRSFETDLAGFTFEHLFLGQNFVDAVIGMINSRTFKGSQFGKILDAALALIEKTHIWSKISGSHSFVYHFLNITLEQAIAELTTSRSQSVNVFFPYLAESLLLTLSHPNRWEKILNVSAWPEVACDTEKFMMTFALPSGVDSFVLQEFTCQFIGRAQEMIEDVARKNNSSTKNLKWTVVMEKAEKFTNLLKGAVNEKNFVDVYNWKRLERAYESFANEVWNKQTMKDKIGVVVKSIEQFSHWLDHTHFKYSNDFRALFLAINNMVTLLNHQIDQMIADNSIQSSHLSLNLPILTKIVRETAYVLPDLVDVSAKFLADPREVFQKFGSAKLHFSKIPCVRGSYTDFIDFKNKSHIQSLEKSTCRSRQALAQEILSDPNIGSMLAVVHNASVGEPVNFTWSDLQDSVFGLTTNVKLLSNFTGAIFPDVPGFNTTELKMAFERSKNSWISLNETYRNRRFIFSLVDSILQLFDNTTQVKKPTFATLKWNPKAPGDIFANLVVSAKFAVWTGNEMFEEITKYLEKLQKSELSMYDLLNTSLLRDLWELIMNFPHVAEVFIKSIMTPAFADVIEDLAQDQQFKALCSSYGSFAQVVQFGPDKRQLGETLYIIMCQLNKDDWQEAFQQLWTGSAFSGLIERVSKAWYSSNPTHVPVRLLSLLERVDTTRKIIEEVTQYPPRFLWGGEDTLLKASVWEAFGNSTLKLMKGSSKQRFSIAVQPLVTLLEKLVVGSKLNFTFELDKGTMVLDKIGDALIKLKANPKLTLKEALKDDPGVSSLIEWAEEYLIGGVESLIYTSVLDSRKLTPFLRLNRTPKDIVCNDSVTSYLVFPPHVLDRKNLEKGRLLLCNNDWFTTSLTTDQPGKQDMSYLPRVKPRHFVTNLGRVLDLILDGSSSDPDFLTKVTPLLNIDTWQPVARRVYGYFGLQSNDTEAWVSPVVERLMAVIGDNRLIAEFLNDMLASTSCALSKVKGGLKWDAEELLNGNRPNFLKFVKTLNDSADLVQIILNTVQQPERLQSIMEDFVVSKNRKAKFCAVEGEDFGRYFEIKNSQELEALGSLQILFCKTNHTSALIEMNPAVFCSILIENERKKVLDVNDVKSNMLYLFRNISETVAIAYGQGPVSTNVTQFQLPWRNGTRWLNIFKGFSEEMADSFQKFTIQSLPEWLSAVGLIYSDIPASWTPIKFFHRIVGPFVMAFENLKLEQNETISLDQLLPKTSYLHEVMQLWLPQIPVFIETAMYSMMSPKKFLALVTMPPNQKPSACRSAVREFLHNPRFQEEDWDTLQHSLCNVSFTKIQSELSGLGNFNTRVYRQDTTVPVDWKTMGTDITKFLKYIGKIVVDNKEYLSDSIGGWADPDLQLKLFKNSFITEDHPVPLFVALKTITHHVSSSLGLTTSCARNSSLNAEFGIHPQLFEMICGTGQEEVNQDVFRSVQKITENLEGVADGKELRFEDFYVDVIKTTKVKDVLKGIAGERVAKKLERNEDEYIKFLKMLNPRETAEKEVHEIGFKLLPGAAKAIGEHFRNASDVLATLSSLNPLMEKISAVLAKNNNTDLNIELLTEALPNSPSTKGIFGALLERSSDILPTIIWTSLLPSGVEKLAERSQQKGMEISKLMCKGSISDYLYNPAFNTRDWSRLQTTLCSFNLTAIKEELKGPENMGFIMPNEIGINAFEKFGENVASILRNTLKTDLTKNLENAFLEASKLSVEPEVMTHIIFSNTFASFCGSQAAQFHNLPVQENRNLVQSVLCDWSTQDFASRVGSNVGKLLIAASRKNHGQRKIDWREIYSSVLDTLGYEELVKAILGDDNFVKFRQLEKNLLEFIGFDNINNTRSVPEFVDDLKENLLKSLDGRKVLHYFSFMNALLRPTVRSRLYNHNEPLTLRSGIIDIVEAAFIIRKKLSTENKVIDSILDMRWTPDKIVEFLFDDPVQAVCAEPLSTWAIQGSKDVLGIEDTQELICSEKGKEVLRVLVTKFTIDQLLSQEYKGRLSWAKIFRGYRDMQDIATTLASDVMSGKKHLVDIYKVERFVQNVIKDSKILNGYRVSDLLSQILKFVDKVARFSEQWQIGMGFLRAIMDATQYFLLSDSNADIYTILSNGTNLGNIFKRVVGWHSIGLDSLSSRQVQHAIVVLGRFYEQNGNDLVFACNNKDHYDADMKEVSSIVALFCEGMGGSWNKRLLATYQSDKSGIYMKYALSAVAQIVSSSSSFVQSRLKLFLHQSNIDDVVPLLQSLVGKFVKAPGGFYRLEKDILKPIPFALWEAAPTLLKTQSELWCLNANISKAIIAGSTFLENFISKMPEPEIIVCEMPKWTVAKLYRWISRNFDIRKIAQLLHQIMTDRYNPKMKCTTPLNVLSELMTLITKTVKASNDPTRKAVMKDCVEKFYNTSLVENLNNYGSFLRNITSLFTELNQGSSLNLTSINGVWNTVTDFVTGQLPVFQTVTESISNIRALKQSLQTSKFNLTDDSIKTLLNSTLNLNWLVRMNFSKESVEKYICERQNLRPFLRLPSIGLSKKALIQNALCNKGGISIILNALDSASIIRDLPKLQRAELLRGDLLEQLVNNIQAILNHFLDLASVGSKLINRFSTGVTSDLLNSIVQVLKENTVDKLLASLQGLLDKLEPIIEGSRIGDDLKTVLQGIRSLKSLQGLNLFTIQYRLHDLFSNSAEVSEYLRQELDLHESAAAELLDAQLDLSKVLGSKNLVASVQELMCNPKELRQLLKINSNEITVENITQALCSLSGGQALKVSTQLLNQLAFSRIIENFVEVGINGVLGKVNLTWSDAINSFNTLKTAPAIMPKLRQYMDLVTSGLDSDLQSEISKLNISTEGIRLLGTPTALKAFGKLLCGKTLKALNQELSLLQVTSKEPQLDKQEFEDLPSEFCRTGYEQVMRMNGGPIIWGFLKPILRGKILYAPVTTVTKQIFHEVNKTFEGFAGFIGALQAWGEGITGLQYLQERRDIVDKMKDLLQSPMVQPILKQVVGDEAANILDKFDINSIGNQLRNVSGLLDLMQLVGNMSQCFELDRFHGFDTEEELEFAAQTLSMKREFIAGMVFLDLKEVNFEDRRVKRSEIQHSFPPHIKYKIRMDIDNVPTTRRNKLQFWQPGPRDDFLEEMRYFRGFLQYQEMIDRAIINVQTNGHQSITANTYLQQFPYPCYHRDRFGFFLKGLLPIIMSVCWLFLVAFLIREFVLEKELKLEEVLRVMGLKYWIGWLAWFISGLCILSIGVAFCVLILKVGGIFPYSDGFIIFLFLMEFAVLVMMYCYLMSTFFKTATIAALTGIVIYLLTFLPFVVIVSLETQLNLYQKLLTSLLMCTSFCYGCLHINRYEDHGVGIQWENLWHSPIVGDEMNFVYSVVMIAIDIVLYFVAAWYISNVWPANEARRQPWYFPFSLKYWGLQKRKNNYFQLPDVSNSIGNFFGQEIKHSDDNEKGSAKIRTVGISLRGLNVVYNQGKPLERVAVSSLSLEFMEGHITTLLGQNGAGKTTTINVLTGQYPPTSGSVYVYGKPIPEEFSEAQKLLGYCPQYNTLFASMSVREHLKFYAQLKGVLTGKQLEEDVDEMLNSMGLWHMQNEQSQFLSGGMQRRLCVALAFIGGSKVIILDEPTSSVDPVARRNIWNLIVKYRRGRTILLTTHHMDEADILSDKVAIIHRGKLLCHGSPLLLKSKFGCGYQLVMARQNEQDQDSDSGRASSSCSEDSHCKETEDILTFVQTNIPMARLMEDNGSEVVISLPQRDADGNLYSFSHLFKMLDANIQQLGYSSYGISSTTLEEVFLTLCGLEDNTALPVAHSEPLPMRRNSIIKPNFEELEKLSQMNERNRLASYNGNSHNASLDFGCKKPIRGYRLKIEQFHALLLKRYYHTLDDWRSICTSILLPCAFIAIAMGFALIKPEESGSKEPSIVLSPSLYGPNGISFFSFDSEPGSNLSKLLEGLLNPPGISLACLPDAPQQSKEWCHRNNSNIPDVALLSGGGLCFDEFEAKRIREAQAFYTDLPFTETNTGDYVYNLTGYNLNRYLLDTYLSNTERRYGGWTFLKRSDGENVIKVWYDNSGFHSTPSYLNSVSNAVLRANMKAIGAVNPSSYGISVLNHPLQLTSEQLGRATILSKAGELGIALVIFLGFAFIPSSFVVYIVRERTQEEKRLQYVGGVGPVLYWVSAFMWDLLLIVIAVSISVVIILIFGLPLYVARLNLPGVIALLLLFGWSTTPLMYLLEKLFNEASIAFMVLYCFNIFVGVSVMVGMLILGLFNFGSSTRYYLQLLEHIALIAPQYCLMGGLVEMAQNHIQADVFAIFGQDTYESPFSWHVILPHICAMAVEGAVLFSINLLLEVRWATCLPDKYFKGQLPQEDSDVSEERKRIESEASRNDVLKVDNVRKVFNSMAGKNVAVDNVSFGIPKGECFGLLGVNGAGKTTLFRILTGHIQPTTGQAYIGGQKVSDVMSNNNEVLGYCPQEDALDDLLTPEQHFTIYGKLRGIPKNDLKLVIERAMARFELNIYANRNVGTLSRGTKRKVCTAISMLGNPQVVLLDEPTTGMDPVTRRLVWNNVLQAIKDQRSVLLTSHSMEECDVLCSRLAIMVNGKIKCLGAPQLLKYKFGTGYTITMRLEEEISDISIIMEFMGTFFSSAILRAHHYNMIEFSLPEKDIPLHDIFGHLEENRDRLGIIDFSISQTTLDQVFVSFARQQGDGIVEPTAVRKASRKMSSLNLVLAKDDQTSIKMENINGVNIEKDAKSNDSSTTVDVETECEATKF